MQNSSIDLGAKRVSTIVSNPAMLRAVQGIVVAIGAPLGWIAIQYLFLDTNPYTDIKENPALYIYMLFGSAVVFAIFGAYVGVNEGRASSLALHDALTGLPNIRYFYDRLQEAYANVDREGAPLSVVIIDLDFFKKINDTYGHPAGDEVLRVVGKTILDARRKNETAARVGGEEFVLLLPNCNLQQAVLAADRVRHAIKEVPIKLPSGKTLKVAASLGVATATSWMEGGEKNLYSRADQALYRAKKNGRDQVAAFH